MEIENASNAIFLINELISESLVKQMHDFYPNSHGTTTFEWTNNSKEILSVEIGNEIFSFFIKYNNQEAKFFNELKFTNEIIKNLAAYIKSI